jgi:hypothetical protein
MDEIDKRDFYKEDLDDNCIRERSRQTFLDKIEQVLEKDQIKSTRNRRACMRNLMKVIEVI